MTKRQFRQLIKSQQGEIDAVSSINTVYFWSDTVKGVQHDRKSEDYNSKLQ